MGMHKNITHDSFPKQGSFLGLRTKVVFRYSNNEPELEGTIVRDDKEAPGILIIKLDDGRYVLANECQYNPQYPVEVSS